MIILKKEEKMLREKEPTVHSPLRGAFRFVYLRSADARVNCISIVFFFVPVGVIVFLCLP